MFYAVECSAKAVTALQHYRSDYACLQRGWVLITQPPSSEIPVVCAGATADDVLHKLNALVAWDLRLNFIVTPHVYMAAVADCIGALDIATVQDFVMLDSPCLTEPKYVQDYLAFLDILSKLMVDPRRILVVKAAAADLLKQTVLSRKKIFSSSRTKRAAFNAQFIVERLGCRDYRFHYDPKSAKKMFTRHVNIQQRGFELAPAFTLNECLNHIIRVFDTELYLTTPIQHLFSFARPTRGVNALARTIDYYWSLAKLMRRTKKLRRRYQKYLRHLYFYRNQLVRFTQTDFISWFDAEIKLAGVPKNRKRYLRKTPV